MLCTVGYSSPLGEILLCADEIGLRGLWFEGSRYFAAGVPEEKSEGMTPVLLSAVRWLDEYFSGKQPDFTPPLHLIGSDFRLKVWSELLKIPYGSTVSYGELAARVGKMSAQAIGGAVGHNPVGIIVPCHRVIGADGSLTGYAAGLERKSFLLRLEKSI